MATDILDWTCDSYNAFVRGQDGKNPKFEKALSTRYPPKDIIESGPASVADSAGVIALYFVPDALTSNRQVCLLTLYYIQYLTSIRRRYL